MMEATKYNHLPVVEYLKGAGADVDIQDKV